MKLIDMEFGNRDGRLFVYYSELFYKAVKFAYDNGLVSSPIKNRGVRFSYMVVLCTNLLHCIEYQAFEDYTLHYEDIIKAWSDMKYIRSRDNGKGSIYYLKRNEKYQKALYFKRNAVKTVLAESGSIYEV